MELDEVLEKRTHELAEFLRTHGLAADDWYIAGDLALVLMGYAIPTPARFNWVIHVDMAKLNLPANKVAAFAPAASTAVSEAIRQFTEQHPSTPMFVPFTQHAIPITFRKLLHLGGSPIWVASLRGLGKINLNELVEIASAENGLSTDDLAMCTSRIPRIEACAAFDWPSRDRWFGTFCSELAALLAGLSVGSTPTAKLQRLGRKHSLM